MVKVISVSDKLLTELTPPVVVSIVIDTSDTTAISQGNPNHAQQEKMIIRKLGRPWKRTVSISSVFLDYRPEDLR